MAAILCLLLFFIAFHCLTQEVPKGQNGPQTYLTPKELFSVSAKEQGFVEHEVDVALSKAKLL